MTSGPRDWLTSEEVTDLTGATYRQLDYWSSLGYLYGDASPGSGHQRRYPRSEVPVIALAVTLRGRGLRPQAALEAADQLLSGRPLRLSGGLLLTYAGQD